MVGGGGDSAMSPASGGAKRGRDPDEDVYVDNLHSHKRYLSEIMASSLNGLSVGDSLANNILGAPREIGECLMLQEEMISQYSPMSEDSDDYRCYDTQPSTNGSQIDAMSSTSTSPVSSPHRFQKPHGGLSSANPYPLPSCSLAAVCSHARRGTESEGRFPSSPNDMCHGADLRRTALLRSVQMRVQGPHAYDLSFNSGQEREQEHTHENEHDHEHEQIEDGVGGKERLPSCPKPIQDEAGCRSPENRYGHPDHDVDYIKDCPSDDGMTEPKFNQGKISVKLSTSMDERR